MQSIVRSLGWGALAAAMLVGGCASKDENGATSPATGSGGASSSSQASSSTSASSSAMTTGGMGGAGGTGGAAPMGWMAGPPALSNDAACLSWSSVSPDAGEEGHLYVVRLAPPSYPFEVTSVHYELLHAPTGETSCDAQAAHRVEVFVGAGPTPEPSPAVITLAQPAVMLESEGVYVVKAPLPQPITLMQEEFLYVAVELPALQSCILGCEDAKVTDRDYWSNATQSPYSWATLASFGITSHARIGAEGTAQ